MHVSYSVYQTWTSPNPNPNNSPNTNPNTDPNTNSSSRSTLALALALNTFRLQTASTWEFSFPPRARLLCECTILPSAPRAAVVLPNSTTPLHTITRDASLDVEKHISFPPILPQKVTDVTTNTRTACKPLITPAEALPPGRCWCGLGLGLG
jgi:hypothetical protein